MNGLSKINNYGDYKKVPDKIIINKIFNEGLDSKLKNSQGSTKKKSKFENVNSSLKSITEKLKTFVTLDSDPTINKKNIEFFVSYIDSISKESDNLKMALEELKKYYKVEGGQ